MTSENEQIWRDVGPSITKEEITRLVEAGHPATQNDPYAALNGTSNMLPGARPGPASEPLVIQNVAFLNFCWGAPWPPEDQAMLAGVAEAVNTINQREEASEGIMPIVAVKAGASPYSMGRDDRLELSYDFLGDARPQHQVEAILQHELSHKRHDDPAKNGPLDFLVEIGEKAQDPMMELYAKDPERVLAQLVPNEELGAENMRALQARQDRFSSQYIDSVSGVCEYLDQNPYAKTDLVADVLHDMEHGDTLRQHLAQKPPWIGQHARMAFLPLSQSDVVLHDASGGEVSQQMEAMRSEMRTMLDGEKVAMEKARALGELGILVGQSAEVRADREAAQNAQDSLGLAEYFSDTAKGFAPDEMDAILESGSEHPSMVGRVADGVRSATNGYADDLATTGAMADEAFLEARQQVHREADARGIGVSEEAISIARNMIGSFEQGENTPEREPDDSPQPKPPIRGR